jgi:polysaccharide export outer membrane protein
LIGLRLLRPLSLAALFFPLGVAAAQSLPGGIKPTPAQAQALLQARPELVEQLRQRLVTSGMTADQIHARLRAEGYPENLLDAYLPGASGQGSAPSSTALRALQELGIADSLELMGGTLDTMSRALLSIRADTGFLQRSQSPFRPDTIRDRFARDSVLRLIANRDSGFVIFGLDLFRSSTSQFQANISGPVDAGYRLGPGDRLVLILTGEIEESYSLDVTREGFIVIPQVGQLFVNNLTLGDLSALMRARLSRLYSGIGAGTTRFSLNVARLRANQIFVVGDLQHPGSYTVSSAGTALTALYAAGGPTINGSLRHIQIRRGGHTVDALDVYDYVLRGDASHDVRLQSGDIVFVPVHGPRARVVGEVVRPATYELKAGESLPQLLEAAGGFTALAARLRVYIERIVPSGDRGVNEGRARTTVDVSGPGLVNGFGPTVPVQNGDVVRVFPVTERVRDRITVRGNVVTPGAQGLTTGMRVADALRAAGGIKSDTYLGEVLISRLESDSTRTQLRVRLRDTTGAVLNDVPLREDDQIQVFSLTTFRPARYVAVAGFVNNPGRFPFREGMTLRDLVLLGGGAKEGALLSEAEIARLPQDRSNGQTAVTIRVPLDSSYLFERRLGRAYAGPPGQPAPANGAPDVVLEPYDNVLILRQENFEYQRIVTVGGEVRFPGTYALKSKRERLSDLLTRAGGLTEEAQHDAILFVRPGPTDARIKSDAGTAASAQDSLLARRATNGRIGLDLEAVLANHDTRENIVLEDGDQVTIPRYNPVIRVQGAVNAPANVTFVQGKDIFYYIDAAGGGSRTADEKRSYVTQPSGKLESVRTHRFFPDAVPHPQAGAVVTVPERDPADHIDFAALFTITSQIIASLVAVVAIIRR